MKLILIRHTRVAVPPGICYGQSDVSLADSYAEELELVKSQIARQSFDAVFSSPLLRCRQLAEDLFPDQEIVSDDRLRELNFGDWELRPWDEIYATSEGKHWMNHYQEVGCPRGESLPDLQRRVQKFLRHLSDLSCQQMAVVTHAGVIRLIKSILEKQTMDEVFTTFSPEYGGVYQFEIK